MEKFLVLNLLHYVFALTNKLLSQATTHINQDGRICVQMPWKPGFPDKLPNNYFRAEEQLRKKESELAKNGKLDEYNQEITNLAERGVVRILSPEEASKSATEPAWYLNHRIVERPDKSSSELRLVFDFVATYMEICLNDALEKGPDYSNSLFRCS